MIYKKDWIIRKFGVNFYLYTAYFLFGLIPLYITRTRLRKTDNNDKKSE